MPATWVAILAAPDRVADRAEWQAARNAADGSFETAEPRFVLRDGVETALPRTADMYRAFARFTRIEDGDRPTEEEPWTILWQSPFCSRICRCAHRTCC